MNVRYAVAAAATAAATVRGSFENSRRQRVHNEKNTALRSVRAAVGAGNVISAQQRFHFGFSVDYGARTSRQGPLAAAHAFDRWEVPGAVIT